MTETVDMTDQEVSEALTDATADAIESVLSLALFTWTPTQLRTVLQNYIDDLTELNEIEDEAMPEGTIQ